MGLNIIVALQTLKNVIPDLVSLITNLTTYLIFRWLAWTVSSSGCYLCSELSSDFLSWVIL